MDVLFYADYLHSIGLVGAAVAVDFHPPGHLGLLEHRWPAL
jgi:hypothetical protein